MAKLSFENIQMSQERNQDINQIGFFSLKNHGDEAVVRIMHDTVASLDLMSVHNIKLGEKYRRVNCIRNANEPLANCPMCAAGIKLEQKLYIHLVQYQQDENGNMQAYPKIWERSAAYASVLANLINEYGPLSDNVFKIKRNGAAGSRDTKYDIMYANPAVFTPERYPKNTAAFDNYEVLGRIVMNKTYEDLTHYLATGTFPQNNNQQNNSQQAFEAPVSVPPGTVKLDIDYSGEVGYTQNWSQNQIPNQTYAPNPVVQQQERMPWETTPPVNRPNRTY